MVNTYLTIRQFLLTYSKAPVIEFTVTWNSLDQWVLIT